MDAPTEYRVDCRDGSAVEIVLDTPEELAVLESYRKRAASERREQARVDRALTRLREAARDDDQLSDLLIVFGLA